MRVLHTLLELRDGEHFFGGDLFTGLCYEVESAATLLEKSVDVIAEKAIVSGVVVAVDRGAPKGARIALGHREQRGPFEYKGSPFTGAVYCFDEHGILESEILVENGSRKSMWIWYPSGALSTKYPNAGADFYAWDQEGFHKTIVRGAARFDFSGGWLSGLCLSDETCERRLLREHALIATTHLELKGVGITDWVLAYIAELSKVERLTLERTRVTRAGLEAFANAPLKQLRTVGSTKITDEELNRFLAAKPNCEWIDERGDE